jgi:ABC-type sugar transport system ATPase subunit
MRPHEAVPHEQGRASGGALLRARGLTKVYGRVTALADADFELMPGEVRALIGSNGAGKSTLIKLLTGATRPTRGSVEVGGRLVEPGDPLAMIRHGVACIYQHAQLAPAMTVLDNIFLGRQPTTRWGRVDVPQARRRANALLERHAIALDLDVIVGSLPAVKQKEVEILKALALDARVLLMDEPTAWLAAADVDKLHATVRALKASGVGIVYISHMLDEIFAVCDTLTVLRDGRVIAQSRVAEMTRPRLVELMVGEKLARESADAAVAARRPRGTGEVRLRARGLTRRGVFSDIHFELHAGEILCITGLVGSRRTELMRVLFGADRFDAGSLELDGSLVLMRGPAQAMAAGVGLVPEDRHRDGLMLGLPVAQNLVMATIARSMRGWLLDRRAIAAAARRWIAELGIQPPDAAATVRLLSGGNQQKVLIGKWLALAPRVILLDEPTVGVDVGAKAEIYAILRAERDKGAAVLVVSSDLEEVMTIADRIAVMVSGRLVAQHDAHETSVAQIVHEIGAAAA